MLRVLLASQATTAGVATCVRDLAKAGVSQGIHVTVACPDEGDLPAWAQKSGATWTRLDMLRSPHPTDAVAAARMRSLLLDHDVVHLHSSKAGAIGRFAGVTIPAKRRPPCVFSPHGWSWFAGGHFAVAYRQFERLAARMTSVVLAVSEEERRLGSTLLQAASSKIQVIENGVDTDHFCPEGPVAERSLDPLVLFVGRLGPQKGPDLAISALGAMEHTTARLRLIGDGATRRQLYRMAEVLGLAERVEFLGELDDPAPHMRAADVVLIPSRYEGMSLVLLESMSCGAAIVASRTAGTEALANAGVAVDVGAYRAAALAIDDLLSHPERRSALGLAARRRACQDYRLERSTGRTVGLWRELAS